MPTRPGTGAPRAPASGGRLTPVLGGTPCGMRVRIRPDRVAERWDGLAAAPNEVVDGLDRWAVAGCGRPRGRRRRSRPVHPRAPGRRRGGWRRPRRRGPRRSRGRAAWGCACGPRPARGPASRLPVGCGPLLHVDVHELAGARADVAHGQGRRPIQRAQSGQAGPAEHGVDGGGGHRQLVADAVRALPARHPALEDGRLESRWCPAGAAVRPTGAVREPCEALFPPAPEPLVGRRPRHALGLARGRRHPSPSMR